MGTIARLEETMTLRSLLVVLGIASLASAAACDKPNSATALAGSETESKAAPAAPPATAPAERKAIAAFGDNKKTDVDQAAPVSAPKPGGAAGASADLGKAEVRSEPAKAPDETAHAVPATPPATQPPAVQAAKDAVFASDKPAAGEDLAAAADGVARSRDDAKPAPARDPALSLPPANKATARPKAVGPRIEISEKTRAGPAKRRAPEPTLDEERYADAGVNPMVEATQERMSTFAMDVDTASYTIVRRKLLEGQLVPPSAVRVEEMLNYFRFPYPKPGQGLFAVQLDAIPSPFAPGRHLMRVGIQAKGLTAAERRPAHLTFLIDVSGSMGSKDKLPLTRQALHVLVDNLQHGDTVGIVTFGTTAKIALPSTSVDDKKKIYAALDALRAGGSTAMAEGLVMAYQQALREAGAQSISRVVIVTNADANVGATTHDEMHQAVQSYIKEGVTLSAIGVGAGNFKDIVLQPLADKGKGSYYYMDSLAQAHRIFERELLGTLQVVAVDAKVQVEFNTESVKRYRLVGYEKRTLAAADFRNDQAVAGQVGAGHCVTALYEVELVPGRGEQSLATVHLRARPSQGAAPEEQAFVFPAKSLYPTFDEAPADLRFATAVAGAAEVLRRSPYARSYVWESVRSTACSAAADDADRLEFCSLLGRIRGLVAQIATR